MNRLIERNRYEQIDREIDMNRLIEREREIWTDW